MSRPQVFLQIGLLGALIVLAAWVTVWYLVSLSFWLWLALIVLGCGMCIAAALRRSKWFFVPASIGLVVAAGISLSTVLGR
jgi:hypothetical protein